MADKKNSWLKNIVNKVAGVVSSVVPLPAIAVGKMVKSVSENGKNNKKASEMMIKAGMAGSIMGEKNYNKAHAAIKGMLKSNKENEANGYVREQVAKIANQKKTDAEMKKYIVGARRSGYKINEATGEVKNPSKEMVDDFNRKFTTTKK